MCIPLCARELGIGMEQPGRQQQGSRSAFQPSAGLGGLQPLLPARAAPSATDDFRHNDLHYLHTTPLYNPTMSEV